MPWDGPHDWHLTLLLAGLAVVVMAAAALAGGGWAVLRACTVVGVLFLVGGAALGSLRWLAGGGFVIAATAWASWSIHRAERRGRDY